MKFSNLLWALAATAVVEAAFDAPEALTKKAIEKGKTRLARINAPRTGSDADTCVLNEEDWTFEKNGQDTRTSDAAVAEGRLQGFINAASPPGLSAEAADWYNILAISPRRNSRGTIPVQGDDNTAYYENGFNPTGNYIAVIDVHNNGGIASSTSAAWALWRQVKSERGGSDSYGDLKAVIHYSCINPGAMTVAGDLFYDLEGDETDVVRDYTEEDEEFLALLGIDNGVFATNLLTNYPDSMGRDRKLEKITAWLNEYNMNDIKQVMGVSYVFS